MEVDGRLALAQHVVDVYDRLGTAMDQLRVVVAAAVVCCCCGHLEIAVDLMLQIIELVHPVVH